MKKRVDPWSYKFILSDSDTILIRKLKMHTDGLSIWQSQVSRRDFIASGISAIAASGLIAGRSDTLRRSAFKAIAFDAFAVFDPRPVYSMAANLFADKGNVFADQWRTTQFEYTWLRTSAGRYKNFWQVTEDALLFAAKKNGIALSSKNKDQLMEQYLRLGIWPDIIPALEKLRQQGVRLCLLSNMTNEMLSSNISHSGIGAYFEEIISTDRAHTYKPDPKAYELGTSILKLKKDEILFVAFAGWDACGAKWFGYPTFWLNRLHAPGEQFDVKPDGTGSTMDAVLSAILFTTVPDKL